MKPSPARSWARALEMTAPIAVHRDRILTTVVAQRAAASDEGALALVSDTGSLTYRALLARSNQYARWALDCGVAKGETVCLLMPNQPEYMAIVLGIVSVGGVVSLLNTRLSGRALAHSIRIVEPRHIIVDSRLTGSLRTALIGRSSAEVIVWVHRADDDVDGSCEFARLDLEDGTQSMT